MNNSYKLTKLVEDKKMLWEAIQIFKKERTKLQNENKIELLQLLEIEILPIYEKALYNCYLLRQLGYKETKYDYNKRFKK